MAGCRGCSILLGAALAFLVLGAVTHDWSDLGPLVPLGAGLIVALVLRVLRGGLVGVDDSLRVGG